METSSLDSLPRETHNPKRRIIGKQYLEPICIIVMLVFFTVLIGVFDADRVVARFALDSNGQWLGKNNRYFNAIYDYAHLPGFFIVGSGLLILVFGYFVEKIKKYRRDGIFVILLLLLGPGLVVNVALKDNLGRARPSEIKEFGGQSEFTQPWFPGEMGKNSSFPSGHASIGFYLIAPWFIFRKQWPLGAKFFLVIGLPFGLLVGVTRILQGGHYLSDVLWSGGLVYLVGYILAKILKIDQVNSIGCKNRK
ncbi:MAG: phosphatase PAP2 family protein [Desulfobulbaceae bacterium]|nr:phosphatase PAP2 family protein [Desulfobulbaceae bacterium]